MGRSRYPKTFDEFCFVIGAVLYIISLIPIARILDHVVSVNPLGLCVGGLGFASLGVIVNKGRINERVLLYLLLLWVCGLIVWSSIH